MAMAFTKATVVLAMKALRGAKAQDSVVALFQSNGWQVRTNPSSDDIGRDLVVSDGSVAYAATLKISSEARPDRVIALLSQAILQARVNAKRAKLRPLAMVLVGDAKPSLFAKVDDFARRYAPDVSIGVVSENGSRHFLGERLDALNALPPLRKRTLNPQPRLASDLFSDLNQWMLKVLLSPEIPENLLTAPRAGVRNASELAIAADVSMMSASRFLNRLREEHFVDDAAEHLRLVRREDLFGRWSSAALRSAPEVGMCFLNPSAAAAQLKKMAARHHACLGLFAAADALGIGHVSGVIPHLYVEKLPGHSQSPWKELVPARVNEQPDLILRKPNAPNSVFRGAIPRENGLVADVLQIWIDASNHPSRGREQADYIRQRVIPNVFSGHV